MFRTPVGAHPDAPFLRRGFPPSFVFLRPQVRFRFVHPAPPAKPKGPGFPPVNLTRQTGSPFHLQATSRYQAAGRISMPLISGFSTPLAKVILNVPSVTSTLTVSTYARKAPPAFTNTSKSL